MRCVSVLCVVAGVCALGAEAPDLSHLDFRGATAGQLPKGWTATQTGKGKGSVWKAVEDESSPDGGKALAQVAADAPEGLFNLCVAEAPRVQDLDLTVSFKATAGNTDQGGGPVWRYQDADNYYIARMNPLEDNFRVYKVVKGRRMQLGDAEVTAAAGKWHTIRVVHTADHIQCYLNGKLHLDVKDDAIKAAGQIGLWTKADAQTRFAGLKVSGK